MALFRFGGGFGGGIDDMFSNMDRMMNQMMGGMFPDPFAMNPFNQFQNVMQQTSTMPNINFIGAPGAGNASFVQSSFVSLTSNGNGPPQIYEETKMNHFGPNGVREERHTVRDSRTGVQKMKVGRHIADRGHVIERSRNHYTGDEEENNEFINIEEEEAPQFQEEWSTRMAHHPRRSHPNQMMIQGSSSRAPRLAITAGPSTTVIENNSGPSTSAAAVAACSSSPSSPSSPYNANSSNSNSSNEFKSSKFKLKNQLKNKKLNKKSRKQEEK